MPAMSLHPGSPVMDPFGEDKAFDEDLFDAFQDLLQAWGPSEYVATKKRVWQALDTGAEPEPESLAESRIARTARRNAIRQKARLQGASPVVVKWSEAHDRGAIEADADMPGH